MHGSVVLSDSNARLVAARRLTSRRARRETGRFLVEGAQAVTEVLRRPELVSEVFATAAAVERNRLLLEKAAADGVRVDEVSDRAAAGLSETVTPQGLVAVAATIDVSLDSVLCGEPKLLAVVVEPNDPGNLGTIIRTADAAGADGLIVVGGGVDSYNGKVVRASAGSLFHIPLVLDLTWEVLVERLSARGVQSIATTGSAASDLDELIASRRLDPPTAWIFGNEAHGLPDSVLETATMQTRIPIYGAAESLNLSVAAAICLYASARAQRR
ncbi:TrmH family RNA methyltransferase [Jatrophihabitans sp. GAS493]|uniref:TrmH family RNA methyltransferase n=1 Tax=Jatrophihabitans sp. GAS493 TaxID=1907575 RepID=UPI000BB98B7A|nr:RNA methyltransferase [Jatrophihabitans sp. GAS493]SOD73767.1 TrmH family RNA methyltransferase [Jatrophihabitans sp. GAS493]